MQQLDLDAFTQRVDQANDAMALADVQIEFGRICQALPDEERQPLIRDYAARLKANACSIGDNLTVLENDREPNA